MLPLSPPVYPYRPDAPLLSLGPAFSEEIARSLVSAIWHENLDQPHETDIRTAAGLTMLEAFRPRDQLETMLAAQGVATHCAIMDNFCRAANPTLPPPLVIKFRANAVAMSRMFSNHVRDLVYLHSRPLPPHPGQPPAPPTPTGDGGDPPPVPEGPPPASPRAKSARTKTAPPSAVPPTTASPSSVADTLPDPPVPLEDIPELPEDIVTRPDGTPGNLTAYLPKAPVVPYVPREPAIMVALATRPKPWRMVNVPKDQASTSAEDIGVPPEPVVPQPERPAPRGLLDMRERIFTGDALARFAATRFDPDAPPELQQFDSDEALVELELISTGGDPAAEAERAAMMAAHPEGKPIVTFRIGTRLPSDATDEAPPDG